MQGPSLLPLLSATVGVHVSNVSICSGQLSTFGKKGGSLLRLFAEMAVVGVSGRSCTRTA